MPWLGINNSFQSLSNRREGGELNASVLDSETHGHEIPLDAAKEGGVTCGSPPSFTSWLYRPYIDLTPDAPEGNPQTKGLILAIDSALNKIDRARIHGLYPTSWREDLFQQAGIPNTENLLPQWLFNELDTATGEQKIRLLWLLHRAFLHEDILHYTEESADGEIALLRAMARQALGLKIPGFEYAAKNASVGSWAAIEATYYYAAIIAKNVGDPNLVESWTKEHLRHIYAANSHSHDHCKLLSRYYRVCAFVPQLKKDNRKMMEYMSLAESYAKVMHRDTEDHETEARTLTFAMYESRCKEALIFGDIDLAVTRAILAIKEAPLRSAGYLALGQALVERKDFENAIGAYRAAVRYGPPDTEVALFMIGQCWEQLNELDSARDAYLSAIEVDPLGIASREQLIEVCNKLGDRVVGGWAKDSLEKLGTVPEKGALPYQRYEGVLGK